MSAPTPSSCLRLAEAIPETQENYRTRNELIRDLQAMAAEAAERTALFLGMAEQARLTGLTAQESAS